MKLPFAKNAKRNVIAGFLNRMVGIVFPFLNRTLFLWYLGADYLGFNAIIRSILGMLSLAELGFGTAIVCLMYKPIAEDDRDTVCAYLNFYRTIFHRIGFVVLGIGLALLPFLRGLIHGDIPAGLNPYVVYLIYLGNSVFTYFLFAYRGPVLSAYQRDDVTLHIHTALQVVQYITVFFVLLFTRNYYAYVGLLILFTLAGRLLVLRASIRLFPDLVPRGELPPETRRKVFSDVKAIFLHKIGDVVSSSADNLVISGILGLSAIAVYGNYFFVVSNVVVLATVIFVSIQHGFGNKIHTESPKKNFNLFMRMTRMNLLLAAWCISVLTALYQPFIAAWTRDAPEYMRHIFTPFIMSIWLYATLARHPLLVFKSAAGLWKNDRWKSLVAAAVNLSLNLSLVYWLPDPFQLDGVMLSTVIAMLAVQIPWESHALFSAHFGLRRKHYYWDVQTSAAVRAAAVGMATWWCSRTGADLILAAAGRYFPLHELPAAIPSSLPLFLARAVVALPVATGILCILGRREVAEFFAALRKKR